MAKHHIKLKYGSKMVSQKLCQLMVAQQNVLPSEVRNLLEAGFIYPVIEFEWVSTVVVTPKKDGKWHVCGLQTLECSNQEGPLSSPLLG